MSGSLLTAGAAVGLVALAGCGIVRQAVVTPHHAVHAASQPPSLRVMRWSAPPPMRLNRRDRYAAWIHTTAGSFEIHLFADRDPVAVNNFVFLAQHQFYRDNEFFRVIKSFVIQTGDPLNSGWGGPGYTFKAELPPPYPYQPGIVAMAIEPHQLNSNGSQFFICTGLQSEALNQTPDYTELGRVVRGWSTVMRIASAPVTQNPITHTLSVPVHPVRIVSIAIVTSPRSAPNG